MVLSLGLLGAIDLESEGGMKKLCLIYYYSGGGTDIMISNLLGIARRYIILLGLVKFFAGLTISFGLGVYSLPILTAEKACQTQSLPHYLLARLVKQA